MHHFPGMTMHDILHRITYKNLQMLMATIPNPDLEEVQDLETLEDFKKLGL